jgi:hypothetical protein
MKSIIMLAVLLLVGVASAEPYISIKQDSSAIPDTGNAYLLVHVVIENHGYNEFEANPFRFKIDVNNVEYDVDTVMFSRLELPKLGTIKLKDDGKTAGYLVFQIPEGCTDYKLVYPLYSWEDFNIIYI